jgi:signal transduction histidine kinase
MDWRKVPRLYRRSILIYAGTIVAPVWALMWLGIQSMERQQQALTTLTAEKFATELDRRMRSAAQIALSHGSHPVARYFFTINQGTVTRPLLEAAPPAPTPPEFLEPERQEIALNRPDLALESYRKLLASHRRDALALSRVARCLAKLGRSDGARDAWRRLAVEHPDERDLSHRPYGIVGAIEAGDTVGLYDAIASGRWELSADQATYFLSRLDPQRFSPYLDQFRFARELAERFHPRHTVHEGELYADDIGADRIFYRGEPHNRIIGFAVNEQWVQVTLRPQLERELGIGKTARQELVMYGSAIAVVLLLLTAGLLLLLRDISRETRINRVRSDFVSGVSHELKTPITLIRLYSETLLGGARFSDLERTDFYRIIARESERLGRLVDRILTFSRVERGAQIYNFEEADPAPVISRILKDYREYLERAGFRLEQSLLETVPAVRFDSAALSQAIVNLLDNAVKYSGDSRDIAVRLLTRENQVVFEVEDHGLGIPESEQLKVFERFYRSPNGSGKGGYGLGLFMVQHIMTAHGGRAEVESQAGRGSRFRLILPLVN